jgi:hypothetical protein
MVSGGVPASLIADDFTADRSVGLTTSATKTSFAQFGATSASMGEHTANSFGDHSIPGLTIHTPIPSNAAQKVRTVSMPEPSFPAVLAVDFLGMIGLIVIFRRRITGNFN